MQKTSISINNVTCPLYIYDEVSSTMDEAWKLIKEGKLPLWGSVLANRQSSGRGRMGRQWQSPPGNMYTALRLPQERHFDCPAASLALGFLMIKSLEGRIGKLALKWPNDLIYNNGKAGGILLESRGGDLVAGIGLNLKNDPRGQWLASRDPGAPWPSALPFDDDPADLWISLVKNIFFLYNDVFRAMTLKEMVLEADKYLFWRECDVIIHQPATSPPIKQQGPIQARIKGLDPSGCLTIEAGIDRYRLWSGTLCLNHPAGDA